MANRASLKKQKKIGLWMKRTLLLTFSFFLLSVAFSGAFIYAYMRETPRINADELRVSQSSMIYDMNNNFVAYAADSEKRQYAKISDIPLFVQNAFIATEDVRFRQHFGIDLRRILGAALSNLKNGFGSEGASTITQQVVKNSFLSPQKTLKRKLQEMIMAIELERKYTKNQILEMYLNKIYFGQNAYGVATAAKTYFNKPLNKLTISEAAVLAGLPQRPSDYDPFIHPDKAEKRRNIVLENMAKYGFITQKQKDDAEKIHVSKMIVQPKKNQTKYTQFIDYVIKELERRGITQKEIYEDGLKIYTTLDPAAQDHMEKVLSTKQYISFPNKQLQAGAVLLDTTNGEIRAIGGSRQPVSEQVPGSFDYATDIQRQPGSVIKPILDYGPAIDYFKWSTYQQINDEKLTLNGKAFKNWDNKFHGNVSMREALKWSYNIPAIKTFMEVGSEKSAAFASKLGFHFKTMYPSYAIGGLNKGVSPLQVAGAYAAFGNQGIFHQPTSIRKIVFGDGNEMVVKNEGQPAMKDYTSYMITDMLKSVVEDGTGQLAQIPGIEVAGKTGTTSLPDNIQDDSGSTDSWFAGYTTRYTAAVWTGYNQTDSQHYLTKKQQLIAKLIFKSIVSEASKGKPTPSFQKPMSVDEIYINPDTGEISSSPGSHTLRELMVDGTPPLTLSKPKNASLNGQSANQNNISQKTKPVAKQSGQKAPQQPPVNKPPVAPNPGGTKNKPQPPPSGNGNGNGGGNGTGTGTGTGSGTGSGTGGGSGTGTGSGTGGNGSGGGSGTGTGSGTGSGSGSGGSGGTGNNPTPTPTPTPAPPPPTNPPPSTNPSSPPSNPTPTTN